MKEIRIIGSKVASNVDHTIIIETIDGIGIRSEHHINHWAMNTENKLIRINIPDCYTIKSKVDNCSDNENVMVNNWEIIPRKDGGIKVKRNDWFIIDIQNNNGKFELMRWSGINDSEIKQTKNYSKIQISHELIEDK